jgi:peptidoglycan/xylan/chitin deacetylase (PgdA/CDA1 family)
MRREVWRGIRGRRQVALTFDAGGEPDAFDELMANLKQSDAAATFFVTGKFVRQHPDILKAMVDAGYPVHNHSWSHPDMTGITDAAVREELERTDQAVQEIGGVVTRPFWRPPFGERNRRVLRVAAEAGFHSIYWTFDSLDSYGEKKSADYILRRVLTAGGKQNPDDFLDGAIILMHVGESGTARAVPHLVAELRRRGFELVTVRQLLTP